MVSMIGLDFRLKKAANSVDDAGDVFVGHQRVNRQTQFGGSPIAGNEEDARLVLRVSLTVR